MSMRLSWKKLSREERIAVIRFGAAKKMSATQIAAEYDECTKNIILGLSRRSGIKLDGKSGPNDDSPKPNRKRRQPPVTTAVFVSELDWLEMSLQERSEYVDRLKSEGATYQAIADSLYNASYDSVRSFASREKRKARKPKRVKQSTIKAIKPKAAPKPKTGWVGMSAAEKEERVRALAADKKTCIEIAAILNTTKKAVQHFVERIGFKLPRQKVIPKPRSAAPRKNAPRPSISAVMEDMPIFHDAVNIMDIGKNQCRAPVWPDRPRKPLRSPEDWMFCGRATAPNSSFCQECHAKFWEKQRNPIRFNGRYMR